MSDYTFGATATVVTVVSTLNVDIPVDTSWERRAHDINKGKVVKGGDKMNHPRAKRSRSDRKPPRRILPRHSMTSPITSPIRETGHKEGDEAARVESAETLRVLLQDKPTRVIKPAYSGRLACPSATVVSSTVSSAMVPVQAKRYWYREKVRERDKRNHRRLLGDRSTRSVIQ